jgi:FkbM family methyltransferase
MKTIVLDLPNGYKITAIENTRIVFNEIWDEKIYENDFTIKEGMIVLDIGANQGFFSLYAASKGAHVISVEPEKRNYKILTQNIRNNNLQDKIRPFQYAVTGHNGWTLLFARDFDEFAASAMVTTSKEFLSNISKGNDPPEIQKVRGITLDKLLSEAETAEIDLLKIDCEGAELIILKNASPQSLVKIKNIVMETHNVYAERDLVFAVKDAGFNIITYRKLDEKTGTGYLFAENKNQAYRPAWDSPVGILETAPYAVVDNKFICDASKSFSSVFRDSRLSYIWEIDGVIVNDAGIPVMDFRPETTGLHTINLEVRDNNGKSDVIHRNIWAFAEDYLKNYNIEKRLAESDKNKIFTFCGTEYFSIAMPQTWHPYRVVVAVEYKTGNSYSLLFEFNNEKMELKDGFNKIQLLNFPVEIEVKFSLTAACTETIRLCWWFDAPEEQKTELIMDSAEIYGDTVVLKPKNLEAYYTINHKETFLIFHKYLPATWDPKIWKPKIAIGISVIHQKRSTPPEHLYFEYKEKRRKLSGWYNEMRIDLLNPDEDLIFNLTSIREKTTLKIEWWME